MFLDTKIKVDGSRSVLCFLPSPFFLFFFLTYWPKAEK